MAAGDSPSTTSELQTAFLDALKEVTGVSAVNTIVLRYLNLALHDIHGEKWWWAERRSTIRTYPPYTTGTVDVAITNLTTRRTVTGTSTAWNTANSYGDIHAIAVGAKMTLGSTLAVHVIGTIGSDTSITLDTTTPYTGDSALDDAGYAIYQDEYSLASDYETPYDVRFFDADRHIDLLGSQDFYRKYPVNSTRGQPRHATIIELGPSGSAALRRRVIFGKAPDDTYLIPYRYYTGHYAVSSTGTTARNLSAAGDEPIIPHPYRMAIVWKALALWFGSRQKNAELAAQFGGEYTTLILRARQRSGNENDRPQFQPAMRSYWQHAKRPWRGTARRYDGGTAWDQLRH